MMNKSAGARSFPHIDLGVSAELAHPAGEAVEAVREEGIVENIVPAAPTQAQISVVERAEKNMDKRNIKQQEDEELSAPKTFMVSVANTERMGILKRQIGTPYNWVVNEALKLWFSQKYPDIIVKPTYKKKI